MSKRGLAMFGLLAVVAMAGCASENWQEKYEEQQRLNLDLSATNDELKQQRAEAVVKNEQFGSQIKQADIEAQKARQAADALAKQNEQLRQQLATSPGTAKSEPMAGNSSGIDTKALNELMEQYRRELGKQAPEITLTKDGNIEITLLSDVTFPSGSSDLSEGGRKSLKALAPLLKGKFAPYQIRVEGHTDSTPLAKTKPKYSDNFGLGSARSLSVVRFMESELAIEPTRLMSASRGQHEPVADDKSETGRRKNRRVEIVVVVPHDAAMSMAK